jgi:UDP-glucose 4-epimerase
MVVVTGAAGFIGGYLVRELLKQGYEVYATDMTPGEFPGDFPIYGWDIRYPLTFPFPANQVSAVIHCAGLLMINGHSPEEYFHVNTIGTYNILEYCRKTGAPLVYLMTHSDMNQYLDFFIPDEPVEMLNGRINYGGQPEVISFITSKVAAMKMILAYLGSDHISKAVILRLANIRGVGSQDRKYYSVFWQFIDKAIKAESIELWGNCTTRRDLIYVKDVVQAIILACRGGSKSGVYNIGSGQGMTIVDEAKAICKAFNPLEKQSKFIYRPDLEEVRKQSCIFDISKAYIDLKWEPRYTYLEAMQDMKLILGGKDES